MKVEGYFPYDIAPLTSTVMCYTHPSHSYPPTSQMSPSELTSFVRGKVAEAIARDSSTIWSGDLPATSFGPYYARAVGEPVPTPPVKYIEGPTKKVKHKDFAKRVRNGDIVISPFWKSGARITYSNGFISHPIQEVTHAKNMATCGIFEVERVADDRYARHGSLDIPCLPFTILARREAREYTLTPYDVGWNDGIVDLLLDRLHQPVMGDAHYALITETLADANKGAIDYATAMAELPETVDSIVKGIKFIVGMYKDARKGEVRLKNRVSRLRLIQNPTSQQKRDFKEASDALSDLWLNWRYNIYPTAKLIEDAVEYLNDGFVDFRRYAHRYVNYIDFGDMAPDGWTQSSTQFSAEFKTFIKRKYSNTAFSGLGVSFGTLYELVPASFMIDWFINLGNLIFAYFSPKLHLEEGATISWKYADDITFTHKQSGARVNVHIEGYTRLVINPSDYCRFSFNPDLNLLRQLDTLSLAWKVFIRNYQLFK